MCNFGSLVGAFMENAMAPSAGNRIGSALEQLQRGGFGGMAGSAAAGASAAPGGMLGGVFDVLKDSLGGAAQRPAQAGGLGAVLGSLLGGGKGAVRGMINAAKSDGQISPEEMQRIVGKLHESGADDGMQQWVMQQMQAPLNVQAFAAEIPNQEVAAEVYTASLLAVEVDTEAEKRYLQELARASGLHPLVVGQIHQTLGVTA